MRIALAQINPTVGDLEGNASRIRAFARRAADGGARLAVFPELALCGYPPRDLVELEAFLDQNQERLEALAGELAPLQIDCLVGYVARAGHGNGCRTANCAALLSQGRIAFAQRKMLLPNYDVFDEWRYFKPAERQQVREIAGWPIGVTICEDVWNDRSFWETPRYERDPVEELAAGGMRLLINIASSPYSMGRREFREEMLRAAARRFRIPVAMVNQAGGNDHLLFDGSSFALGPDGAVIARAASFQEDLVFFDADQLAGDLHPRSADEVEAVYDALVMGVRDYLCKCGFSQAVIGLSGGIDSSITAVIAVDALGPDNVIGVAMPGPYSSEGSLRDAKQLAQNLGVRFEVLPINDAYESFVDGLQPVFAGLQPDVTEENIQSRLRGLTLMALSNKLGALVLTTGNKSELAVGYCTLYGDMVGGLAVISDAPKTLVYQLSSEANRRRPGAIPESVFSKPPSAELAPDQKDTDSLPEYEELDPILAMYVEQRLSPNQIAERVETPLALIQEICSKVDRNEYKRQQAAPGLRVTSKAFGLGRRFPIAQRFRF